MHTTQGIIGSRSPTTKSTTSVAGASASSVNDYVEFAVTDMQGWRIEMEDSHFHVPNWDKDPKSGLGYHLFGVFDGHGGSTTAQVVAKFLPSRIKNCKEYKSFIEGGRKEAEISSKLVPAFTNEFIRLDREMSGIASDGVSQEMSIRDSSGCTAIVVLVAPTFILFVNAGDSRAIMVKSGEVVFGTKDHKPMDPIEDERIRAAGGKVQNGRVDADLAVSRAFGDFSFKNNMNVSWEKQKVSVEPECTVIKRTPDSEYIMLCCDGIWDVMTNEQCNEFVAATLADGEHDLGHVVEDVVQRCLLDDSKDNMTAMVVMLKGGCKHFTEKPNLQRERPMWIDEDEEKL